MVTHSPNRAIPFLMSLITGVLFIGSFAPASAQVVGDRIVVTATSETKIHKEVIDKVYAGSIHTVIAVNEKWCALNDVRGWLPLQRVMNLDMAKEHYDERIDENDNDWDAYATRGMIYRESEKLARAFTDLNKSLQINPKNANTWNNRGIVLNAQGKYELAIKDIRYSLQLNENNPNAFFNLGTVYYAMNRHADAIEAFDQAIELKDENPWYYISRGSARHSIGNEEGALADYRKSIQLEKRMADAYIGISNVYLGRDDLENAMQFINQAIEAQPRNAMALNARGWLYYKQNEFSDALLDYNQAVRFAPKMPVTYNNRGVCYAALDDFEQAINDYARSLDLMQYSPITFSNRGTAYFNSGDFEKAKADFAEAIRTGGSLAEPMNAAAWFHAVCPEESYRDGEVAVQLAEAAVKATGGNEWTTVDTLAAAHAESGEFEKAVSFAEQAIELAPESRKQDCRERLALYREKKAFRSTTGKTSDPSQRNARNTAPRQPTPVTEENQTEEGSGSATTTESSDGDSEQPVEQSGDVEESGSGESDG